MERQNVTLSLPRSLLKQVKILSAKNGKSLSELIREFLEKKVKEETDYQKAKERHMKLLMKGFDLGTKGKITLSRAKLHERR